MTKSRLTSGEALLVLWGLSSALDNSTTSIPKISSFTTGSGTSPRMMTLLQRWRTHSLSQQTCSSRPTSGGVSAPNGTRQGRLAEETRTARAQAPYTRSTTMEWGQASGVHYCGLTENSNADPSPYGFTTQGKECIRKCEKGSEEYYNCQVGANNGFTIEERHQDGTKEPPPRKSDRDFCSPVDDDIKAPPRCPEFQKPNAAKNYLPGEYDRKERNQRTKEGNFITFKCKPGYVIETDPTKNKIVTTCTGKAWNTASFRFPKCVKKSDVKCRVPSNVTLKHFG